MSTNLIYCYKCGHKVSNASVCPNCYEVFGNVISNSKAENIVLLLSFLGICFSIIPILAYVFDTWVVVYIIKQLKVQQSRKFVLALILFIISIVLALTNSIYSIVNM